MGLGYIGQANEIFSLAVADVFRQLIKKEEANVRRLQQHLEEINDDSTIINPNIHKPNEALFSVIKDRHSIYATIENVVHELNRYG